MREWREVVLPDGNVEGFFGSAEELLRRQRIVDSRYAYVMAWCIRFQILPTCLTEAHIGRIRLTDAWVRPSQRWN